MSDVRFDVIGIGNAIVDVIAHAEDSFLDEQGIAKGGMTLIDDARAESLYAAMGPAVEISGGSGANTLAGVASLGGRAAYVGKVADDQLGSVFRHDIQAAGVAYETPPANGGLPTARCLILVTPDAQRSMNTFLGASTRIGAADLDLALFRDSAVTYVEGYLWDAPEAKEAILAAMKAAKAAGRKVAMSLSDGFCVDRHRAEFLDLAENFVDILFANETEILSLYQVDRFDDALQRVRAHCELAALTRSEHGSVVVSGDEVHVVRAEPVAKVVDTTGAGDLYAAGFLKGLVDGRPLADCARMGGIAAAEIISHMGARPETSLAELVAASLG
ncbi:adenosine kinase [Roseospirillum parvum]|uniref:Sugar or nucleoside kinase, ribokinase family n=1 Tax=Roseospirillum parvum TaxID=83401 RepID=A0A1G8FT91_9PROT|nr:adenosine kinase [Roseospirillum parvum]SDH85327.1 Sugar or nucleoside kinase, ribokinase family [Roseospirillum parvum]